MTKDIRLSIVADGYLFSTEVEVSSTFTVPISQLIINISVPTGFTLVSAVPSLGVVDINSEKWIINNLSPKESITGKFTFRIDDISELPGEIEFALSNPPVGEGPNTDNSTKINVDGASCEDLLSTCFGSIQPYVRYDLLTVGDLELHVRSTGVQPFTAVEDADGEYTITAPESSQIESIYVAGGATTLSISDELSITVADLAGNDILLTGKVINVGTGTEEAGTHVITYDLSTAGSATTTVSGLDVAGGDFYMLLTPVTKINP